MRQRIILVASAIVGFVLLISVVYHIGFEMIFSAFLEAKTLYLIPYILVALLVLLTLIVKWKIILSAFGYDVSLSKLVLYKCCGFAAAYLTPSAFIGGEGVRAYLLSKHGISYSKGLSVNIIDKSVELTVNVLFTIIGTIMLVLYVSLPKNTLQAIIIGLVVAIILVILYHYQMIRSKAFFSLIVRPWKGIHRGFFTSLETNFRTVEKNISEFFCKHRMVYYQSLLLSLIAWVFMFLEYKLLLLTLGYNASLIILFLVISVTGLAYIFPIPAALGVLEGGQASLFKFSNMGISKGIALSIIVRMKDLVVSFVGLFYIFNYGVSLRDSKKSR